MKQRSRGSVGAALMLGGLAVLLWLERKRPLRPVVEPRLGHIARNLAVGAVTAASVSAVERPIVTRVALMTEERHWGLVSRLARQPALQAAVTVVLMDYTLYWWHVLLHRIPALWRLHEPHHIDRDLDASTAIRFHFTEFLASVPWRCAQIALIGAGPRTLALWQTITLAEVLFHHSNVRLSHGLERVLCRFIVTPRMHGLHHSIVRDERDSNFSSGLSVWDRLHGTARIDPDRDDVIIGLQEYVDPADVTLVKMLALPFVRRPPRGDHRPDA